MATVLRAKDDGCCGESRCAYKFLRPGTWPAACVYKGAGPWVWGCDFFQPKTGYIFGTVLGPSVLATGPTEIPGCPLLVPNVDPLWTHLWPKFGAKGGPTFDSPFAADFSKKEERTEVPVYRPTAPSTVQGPQGGTRDPTGKKHTKKQLK